jgi:hypothetical protein
MVKQRTVGGVRRVQAIRSDAAIANACHPLKLPVAEAT